MELGLVRVESTGDAGVRTVEQRAVVLLDHPRGRAYDACELEHGDAGREHVAGEGRAQVIDPGRCRDT
jgi:hypothetical protein